MDTAVLFETFARPQYARQVFDQIKKAKPKKLYFYSNKARVDRPDEVRNNEEIRMWMFILRFVVQWTGYLIMKNRQ